MTHWDKKRNTPSCYHMVSINKDVSEHNLIAWRIVKDHIYHGRGLLGVVITKELLNSAQCGCQHYHAYLEERKTGKEKGETRKHKEGEIARLKNRNILKS